MKDEGKTSAKQLAYIKEWGEKNREKTRKYKLEWSRRNTERHRGMRRKWKQENQQRVRDVRNATRRKKYGENALFRFECAMRTSIVQRLKRQNSKKQSRFTALCGATVEVIRMHLESRFTDGMTWDNYGLKGWHIDHIKPVSCFDLADPEQQKACFHYTNLQPLWWYDNRDKADRLDWVKPPSINVQ